MLEIRSLDESARRYAEGSIKAYLEGKKNENWIKGILLASGQNLVEIRTMVHSLHGYGDHRRYHFLDELLGS